MFALASPHLLICIVETWVEVWPRIDMGPWKAFGGAALSHIEVPKRCRSPHVVPHHALCLQPENKPVLSHGKIDIRKRVKHAKKFTMGKAMQELKAIKQHSNSFGQQAMTSRWVSSWHDSVCLRRGVNGAWNPLHTSCTITFAFSSLFLSVFDIALTKKSVRTRYSKEGLERTWSRSTKLLDSACVQVRSRDSKPASICFDVCFISICIAETNTCRFA